MKKKLKGLGVALITPFDNNGNLDSYSLKNLVNYVIDGGVNYIVILGTTSEYPTLSLEEKKEVIDTIVSENKSRVPLVLCIGGNNTQNVVEQIKKQDLSSIEAILSPSPYYNKPSQEGIYQHYKHLSENSKKPIIIYNVPGRTASNILPETTVRLAENFHNIIGIKEASGDIKQYMKIIKDVPEDFSVISGDDDLALNSVYNGGIGLISVTGQAFVGDFSNMIARGLEGNTKEANKINYKLLNIIDLAFKEGNPVGIKEILFQLGVIKHNNVRLPLVHATKGLSKEISEEIRDSKLGLA